MYQWVTNIILISAVSIIALLILIFRDAIGKVLIKINGLMKKIGRKVSLQSDWESKKLSIMEEVVQAKFEQHPDLAKKLTKIEGVIQEENSWNDTFWGVCNGIGKNNLGIILMKIRDEFLNT